MLEADAAGGEGGQQRAILGADRGGGVPDLQVRRPALQQRRLHESGGRQRVDGQVRRGVHPRAVLQVRDPLAQGVEVGDEGVAGVRLAPGPAVAGDLEGGAVPQDGLAGQRGLAEQVPDDVRSELGLRQVENPASLGAGSRDEVAGVEGPEVIRPQEAGICFGLAPRVAPDAQGGLVAQDRVADQRRLEEQVPDDARRKLLLHQVPDLARLGAGSAHEVAGVPRRLVQ